MASPSRTWRIEIGRTAEKQIQKLSRPAQESIVRFLRERVQPSDDPRQFGKPLHGDKGGLWRYRVGDYRLVCDIQDERITVAGDQGGASQGCVSLSLSTVCPL